MTFFLKKKSLCFQPRFASQGNGAIKEKGKRRTSQKKREKGHLLSYIQYLHAFKGEGKKSLSYTLSFLKYIFKSLPFWSKKNPKTFAPQDCHLRHLSIFFWAPPAPHSCTLDQAPQEDGFFWARPPFLWGVIFGWWNFEVKKTDE